MNTIIPFLFGAIIGSFLNVVAFRFNSGLSLGGRSKCPHCSKFLHPLELIPIIGFFIVRGRCSRCGARISWQYPLIELFTALVFVTVPTVFLPVFCFYIVILIYDLRHKIIPDSLVYISIALALITAYVAPAEGIFLNSLYAGLILFVFFALIWFLSAGKAMGFGDAKLALSIGILLGISMSLSALILSFWLGAAFGLIYLFLSKIHPLLRGRKQITMKSEIPFAPFLVLGAWFALILELDILHVALF